MNLVLRGEVWWVSFDPSVGGEIQKTRPAVIVSSNSSNHILNRLQVVPISSQVDRVYPCETLVTLNGETRKAMADQITTASKLRFKSKLGVLSDSDMERVEAVMRLQLGLG